jgi:hypothetical protein
MNRDNLPFQIELHMLLQHKYKPDDFIKHSEFDDPNSSYYYLKTLTQYGEYVQRVGIKTDITTSSMLRYQWTFDTLLQRITLTQTEVYDESERRIYVNYNVETEDLQIIKEAKQKEQFTTLWQSLIVLILTVIAMYFCFKR